MTSKQCSGRGNKSLPCLKQKGTGWAAEEIAGFLTRLHRCVWESFGLSSNLYVLNSSYKLKQCPLKQRLGNMNREPSLFFHLQPSILSRNKRLYSALQTQPFVKIVSEQKHKGRENSNFQQFLIALC